MQDKAAWLIPDDAEKPVRKQRAGKIPTDVLSRLKMDRGLKEWKYERGYLRDTLLTCQDRFKKYLDYYGIEYKE